jgi:hypothetical protein
MRSTLYPLALLLATAAPAAADTSTFLCRNILGQNPFRLDFERGDGFEGTYTVTSAPRSNPVMAGGGRHSLLDGGTSRQIVDGPLFDTLGARYIHVTSDTSLTLDGGSAWPYYCENAKR